MRRLNDSGRATNCCSDQAPFSTGSGHCLKCLRCFIVDHPTLPQAAATSMPPVSEFVSTASFGWHDFGSGARPLTLLPNGSMLIANRPLPGPDPAQTLWTYTIQSASMQNA